MKDIDLHTIGIFRRIEVAIRGSNTKPIPAIFIEEEINKLLKWYQEKLDKLHPIELATIFHIKFEEIHPFTDGNGRVGREIFNYIVTKSGYPSLNFDITRRDQYLDGLEHANNGNFKSIFDYVCENYLEQLILKLGSNPLKKLIEKVA